MRVVAVLATLTVGLLPGSVAFAQAQGAQLAMATVPTKRTAVTSSAGPTGSMPPPQAATPQQLPGDAGPPVLSIQPAGPMAVADDRGALGFSETEEAGEDKRCALGELCLGPVLNLGVINPVGFGVHARIGDYFGFGADYQFLPEVSLAGIRTSASLVTVDARAYPFGGAFFVSAGFAYQVLNAVTSADFVDPSGRGYRVDVEGSVGLPMAKFGLGFFGGSGLVMGIDVALEVPLADTVVAFEASTSGLSEAEMREIASLEADVEDAARGVLEAMPVLVQVNLLRLGYVF